MAGGGSGGGMFQKVVTVVLLFGMAAGLQALLRPPEGPINPASMGTLGFIILAAYVTADLAERIHLPHITGYLLTGLACGPYFLGLLNDGVISDLRLFNALAVALIALSAGGALSLEMLRQSARRVAAVLFSQFGVLIPVITGLVVLLSGTFEGFALHFMTGLPLETAAAVAMVLAVVASAQSPAASIAIIESTRAKGAVSDTVLGVSVLNNVVVVVLFAIAMAAAGALDPELVHRAAASADGAEPSLLRALLIEVGGAGVLGVALGFGISAYIRFVNQEFLLVLAAMSFLVTWAAGELGINEVLAFLAAGFVVRNYTAAGDELAAAVSTLSLPVYVLFFFIAGAGIHVSALEAMWPFALLIFAARMASLFAGTALGRRVGGGPPELARYGWMGFGAQAGIALSMAIEVGHAIPGIGMDIETLAVAGIALNEMFGPVLLQFSLGLAGELPKEETRDAEEGGGEVLPEPPPSDGALPTWIDAPVGEGADPWGPPPQVDSTRLTRIARGIRADLQVLVRDLRSGPVSARRLSAHRYMDQLRREFLRFHHRALVLAQREDLDGADRVATIWRGASQLARRWENQILDRAASADFRADSRAIEQLVGAVDRIVAQLDRGAEVEVVMEPERFLRQPEDGLLLRLGRARLRLAASLRRRPLTRRVDVFPLARFYLSGHVPGALHPVVGLMTLGERHLVTRARALFEVVQRSLTQLLDDPSFARCDAETWAARLQALREEVEEEFSLVHSEVDRLADETVRVAAVALGRQYRAFKRGLELAGTPELPARKTRYSRVYDRRQADLDLALERLEEARLLTRGVAGRLAMELELVRLRGTLRLAMDQRVDALERELRGRVAVQLGRVLQSLDEALGTLREHLDSGVDPAALSEVVWGLSGPLARVAEEALGSAESLRNSLKTEAALEPLRASLDASIDELTDRFTVDTGPPERLSGRGLPPSPEIREVEFRAAVRRTLESAVNRDLSDVMEQLLGPVDAAVRALGDLSRALTFNTELALTELEVSAGERLDEPTRRAVRETLLAAMLRAREQLQDYREVAERCAETVASRMSSALLDNIDELIGLLVEGRWGEPRLRAAQRHLQRRRALLLGELEGLSDLRERLGRLFVATVGEENTHRLRAGLGLPDPMDAEELGPRVFGEPPQRVDVPVAFQRLFADTSLDAGALLTGREHEVEKVRRILLGEEPGTSRAVAVVGVGGIGQDAVVKALVRGLSERLAVTRHELTEPVTDLAQVEDMLSPEREGVVIVEGLHWLFGIRPGGFAPLRRFLQGVLEDRGRNAWLISAQRPVWAYANRVVPLEDVFPEQVHLHALEREELRRAVLARHRLSGFEVRFTRGDGHPLLWLKELITAESRDEEVLEAHYFERLHEATGGVLADALQLWMASIKDLETGSGTMVIGELPRTPLHYVRRLPEAALMTLRQVARQGRLTVEDHATQFRVDRTESEAELSRMTHWGLLVLDARGFYTFSPWLLGTLYRVLRERRLVG